MKGANNIHVQKLFYAASIALAVFGRLTRVVTWYVRSIVVYQKLKNIFQNINSFNFSFNELMTHLFLSSIIVNKI